MKTEFGCHRPRKSPNLAGGQNPRAGEIISCGTRQHTARRFYTLLLLVVLLTPALGCASSWVRMRESPLNPLNDSLQLLSRKGPQPTQRTVQFLRRYNLESEFKGDPRPLLPKVQLVVANDSTPDNVYSLAELAYLAGKKAESKHNEAEALDMYSAAVANTYMYLLDDRFSEGRNPYDPQFRRSCDLYNGALESALRMLNKQGKLKPGETHKVKTAQHEFDMTVTVRGPWRAEEFDHFEFVSDYEVTGLRNHYRTYGLGVPMIAVRKAQATNDAHERFYPPRLSFPVTAFLRVTQRDLHASADQQAKACELELYDPLAATDINIDGRLVPLESDYTAPLAYFLNHPIYRYSDVATTGLLMPESSLGIKGIYMLDPYDPRKIPVIMIHGLWSSPFTWTQMYNDLRAVPEVRNNYQFWFYLYPSGQPFWVSSAQFRKDLAETRQLIDPLQQAPALDQIVLLGHSMGGLIAKQQTIASGDDFLKLVSDRPISELKASPEDRQRVESLFFFEPNKSIRRIVTLGTPHRGSNFANSTTRWLGHYLITMPKKALSTKKRILDENPNFFRDAETMKISTSIDSLSPKCSFLQMMLLHQRADWVRHHNVVGLAGEEYEPGTIPSGGDGIVGFSSAHLDDVDSEIVVDADHMNVHQHPLAVLEVRRILRNHLAELKIVGGNTPPTTGYVQPVNRQQGNPSVAPQQPSPTAGYPTAGSPENSYQEEAAGNFPQRSSPVVDPYLPPQLPASSLPSN